MCREIVEDNPVVRVACLNLPEFPLQLLLHQHPEWDAYPAAVVDRDAAQGVILWSNERARASRILPGLRYAAALSLVHDLRAGTVPRAEIDTAIASLTEQIRFYTPDVEPSHEEPGVFWLGASGLSLLYPSLVHWANLVRDEVVRAGFHAALIVGFTRFGTYALAKDVRDAARTGGAEPAPSNSRTARVAANAFAANSCGGSAPQGRATECGGANGEPAAGCWPTGPARPPDRRHSLRSPRVLETPSEERERAAAVPLSRLSIEPGVRDTLERLGVATLGDFLALPANGIRTRFGEAAHRLHRMASGDLETPLQPAPAPDPVFSSVHLDDPETNLERLLTVAERELRALVRALDERGRVLSAVAIQLGFDDGSKTAERLQPASPTLDLAQIVELLRLRLAAVLEACANARGVTEIRLECEGGGGTHTQGELFATRTSRDRPAAARAMARVRAELGDRAVVRAVLREGHLPEARFEWEPVDTVAEPAPRAVRTPPLVRRIYTRPVAFSPGRHCSAEADLIRHIDEGMVRETLGPFIVSGGWWAREVQREYYFVRTSNDRVLWMYYDRMRMGWFIQGEVE